MAEKYLHIGTTFTFGKKRRYKCGEPAIPNNMTDAQAQKLAVCPRCRPQKAEVVKPETKEGWL